MLNQFSRTQLLLGRQAMDLLAASRVIVFGVGGVGGNAAEALARSGLGHIDLVDDDLVCLTNVNRQVIATVKTVGKPKVEAMANRIAEINPHCQVTCYRCFYLPENADQFDFTQYDYVLDCVDTVTAKLNLIQRAQQAGTPVISAMGAANKLDPTQLKVGDIYETSICPLARVIRKECRKRGIPGFKTVYSTEPSIRPLEDASISCRAHCICPPEAQRHCTDRRDIPGSVSWVPPVAGMIMAGEVVRDFTAGVDREA